MQGNPSQKGHSGPVDKMWSTGEGSGNPLQYSSLGNSMESMKRQNDKMTSVCFQAKLWKITVIQVYVSTTDEEAEVDWFYEDLQQLLETTPKRDILFIIGDWNAKVGSQEIPGIPSKFGFDYKMRQRLTVLSRKHTVYRKHTFPTTQETALNMDIPRWSIPKSEWS